MEKITKNNPKILTHFLARRVFVQTLITKLIAQVIKAGKAVVTIGDLANWQHQVTWFDGLLETKLDFDSEIQQALRTLRNVARDTELAQHAQVTLNRSTALARANAALKRLLETGANTILNPKEWQSIKEIAEKWQDIVIEASGAISEEVLRKPLLNPYEGYSGLPITGPTFVSHDAIQKIAKLLVAEEQEQLPAIILFGHRRMGKTSILRNLERATTGKILLVYLDMQDSSWVNHTGELLLDFAEAIHRRIQEAHLDAGPDPIEIEYANLGKARRTFNALLDRLEPQMTGLRLVLAVDEFELIEDGIEKNRIDLGLLPYLRALNQRHRWLALIFGGLHTIDEMGRDYRDAFFGQTIHIRVGYLSHDNAIRLITQPHPDFALEYAPELRKEIYRLTHGQPYLLQRLCWELVNHWNERFMKEGETTPRTLELNDLELVLNADFYHSAEYYFDGVWSNVTLDEQKIMKLMAQREAPWTQDELTTANVVEDIVEVLELLKRHDVILTDNNSICFASELLRRWVAK